MSSDSDLLARIDERTATLIENQNRLEDWMIRQDTRICNLEACQNKILGVSAGVSGITAILTALGAFLVKGLIK